MAVVAARFDIWLAKADLSLPSSKSAVFPCLIISPDETNRHLDTVIVTPIIRDPTNYPTRIDCRLADQPAKVAIDKITTIDKSTLIKKLGTLPSPIAETVLEKLTELFAA